MYSICCIFITFSSSQYDGKYQCAHTGTDMNHITAGKIHGTDLCQESAFAPYHMCHRIVYQNRPEQNKEKQGFEFYPSHQGSRNQRRCDHCKHHLKGNINKMRNRCRIRSCIIHSDSVQAKPSEITDYSAVIATKREGISEKYPHNYGKSHDKGTRHHGIYHIFSSHQPSIEKGKTRCHKKYQCRADQHKSSVSCVHNNILLFSYAF